MAPEQNIPDAQGLAQSMQSAAEQAVSDTRASLRQELDYTAASLPVLQAMLKKIQEMAALMPEGRKALFDASIIKFGAYFGEVLRRELGGVWVKDIPGAPPRIPMLSLGRKMASPMSMVMGALENKGVSLGEGRVANTPEEYFSFLRQVLTSSLEQKIFGSAGSLDAFRQAASDDPQISSMLIGNLEMAIRTADEKWGVDLDFSEKSLDGLEAILAKLYELTQQAAARGEPGPTNDQLNTMCLMWGVYLGEVMRRHFGGKWKVAPSPRNPNGILQLAMGQASTFPQQKIYKRLINGQEDNVAFYFRAMRQTALNPEFLKGNKISGPN